MLEGEEAKVVLHEERESGDGVLPTVPLAKSESGREASVSEAPGGAPEQRHSELNELREEVDACGGRQRAVSGVWHDAKRVCGELTQYHTHRLCCSCNLPGRSA